MWSALTVVAVLAYLFAHQHAGAVIGYFQRRLELKAELKLRQLEIQGSLPGKRKMLPRKDTTTSGS